MAAKILVVEDDQSLRALIRLHLANAGYEVGVAEDGIAAGYMVLRDPPDLIICDVHMPHMDGFTFVAALREDPALPRFPVIFLTSLADGQDIGKELGAVGYLNKPVRSDKLLELVAQHVPDGKYSIG